MDNQQARRVNEAAQKFAEAVRESMQTVSDQSVEAQERSRQLTQSFFDSVVQELRNQAASQRLMEQGRRQQEAFQQLTEESMGAYREFLGSMFSYYQANMEQAHRGATGSRPPGEGTTRPIPPTRDV